MTLRAPFTLTAVLTLIACAGPGAQNQALQREQLDAYSIPKPLAEVWPEALRHVSNRGYDLVGKDRRAIWQEEQGTIGKFFSDGHETQAVSERRWIAETASNRQNQRYRVVGTGTGSSSCRIEFYLISRGDPSQGLSEGERVFRDVPLEIDFIEQYDSAAAERILAAGHGGKM